MATTLGDDELQRIVARGRKFTQYLTSGATQLDELLGMEEGTTCQIDSQHRLGFSLLRQWDADLTTGRTPTTFKTVSRVLDTLSIGSNNDGNEAWQRLRKIDTGIFPRGHNFPLTMSRISDEVSNSEQLDGHYEAILNVFDGVIIITHITRPSASNDTELDYLEPSERKGLYGGNWRTPSDVVGGMFTRLHAVVRGNPQFPIHANYVETNDAASEAMRSGVLAQSLPMKYVGSWLPVLVAGNEDKPNTSRPSLSRLAVERRMMSWLKYIVVQVPLDNKTRQILDCCMYYRSPEEHCVEGARKWRHRATFRSGHWSMYALLGSVGVDVVWLLAKRKSEDHLGIKAVKSITVFLPDEPEGLTAEERERYIQPTFLFEISNVDDDLRSVQQKLEAFFANDTFDTTWHHWRDNSGLDPVRDDIETISSLLYDPLTAEGQ